MKNTISVSFDRVIKILPNVLANSINVTIQLKHVCTVEMILKLKNFRNHLIGIFFIVQGYWTSWSDWGACNASCGGGIRIKQRTCFHQDVGDDALLVCIGDDTENDTCNTNACPSKKMYTNDDHIW